MVTQDRFADLGVEENNQWLDVYDLGLSNPNDPPFKNGWLKNDNLVSLHSEIPMVSAITINEVTTNSSRIKCLQEKYQASIESMEGAALHFVCLQENIPFIQLRAVSNYIGERDKRNWQMQKAILSLNEQLITLLGKINS
jgi:futalosine hydrolase